MKIMEEKLTIQRFIEMVSENELSLEHPLQREAGRWNGQKRQAFVESIINGLYIPPFFVVDKNGSYLLDGLQRFTTISDIVNDNFTFIDDVKLFKNGMIYNLSDKKFSEIDKKLQDKILQFNFTFSHVTDATSREIEQMFYNLNNAEQMSESEKASAIIGIEASNWLNKTIKNNFFVDKVNLTPNQRKAADERTIVYQYTYLTNTENVEGVSQAEYMSFLRENRDIFTKELKSEITSICEYISKSVIDNNNKYKKLTKGHIPMLMITAKQAINDNINSELFGNWIIQFFKDYKHSVYQNKGCGAGNVKKEKTLVRIEEMKKHFLNYIQSNIQESETVETIQVAQEPAKETIQETKAPIKTSTNLDTIDSENWENSVYLPSNVLGAFHSTSQQS